MITLFPSQGYFCAIADRALLHFAQTTNEITVLMARYCEKLGKVDKAA